MIFEFSNSCQKGRISGTDATYLWNSVRGDINESHTFTGYLSPKILEDQWHGRSVLERIRSAFKYDVNSALSES